MEMIIYIINQNYCRLAYVTTYVRMHIVKITIGGHIYNVRS